MAIIMTCPAAEIGSIMWHMSKSIDDKLFCRIEDIFDDFQGIKL